MGRNNLSRLSSERRSFLKTAGVTAAGLASGVSTVGARGSDRLSNDLYLESLRLREKGNWDVDQWRRWLANQGADFKYQDMAFYTPAPGDDTSDEPGKRFGQVRKDNGPKTSNLDANETWHSMTYTRLNDTDRFNFEWSLNDGWDDSGASPRDWPAMSFEHDYYNFSNDYNSKLGPYVSHSTRDDDIGPSYRAYEYNEDSHAFYTEGRFESHFDVPLYAESSSQSIRQIYTRYHHTWDNVAVDSIGVDTDSVVTVNFAKETDRWITTAWCEEEEMDSGDSYLDKSPNNH